MSEKLNLSQKLCYFACHPKFVMLTIILSNNQAPMFKLKDNYNYNGLIYLILFLFNRLGQSSFGVSLGERGNGLMLVWNWSPSQTFCFWTSLQLVLMQAQLTPSWCYSQSMSYLTHTLSIHQKPTCVLLEFDAYDQHTPQKNCQCSNLG